MSARTIATRVAQEFDGTSVGQNVGYDAGGESKRGARILYATDFALIGLAQKSPDLEHVSVVVIDEAHEHSLHTHIVLGLCLRIQRKRRDTDNPLHVVVSSATIDPADFLRFFDCPKDPRTGKAEPLRVSGRQYAGEWQSSGVCVFRSPSHRVYLPFCDAPFYSLSSQ